MTDQPQPTPATEPIAVRATRWHCPHCRRGHTKRAAALTHIARCWHNPAARGCKTCSHFIPSEPGPYPEHPPFAEDCGAGVTGTIPRTACPQWATDTTA